MQTEGKTTKGFYAKKRGRGNYYLYTDNRSSSVDIRLITTCDKSLQSSLQF